MENDLISRQVVLDYLDRIYNSGMGKKKSHEYITKFVSKLPPAMTAEVIANYHKEHGEVVVTTDVWEDAEKALNSTPLDLEGLKSDMKALNCGYPYGLDYLLECLKKRLGITIIEADKE